MEAQRLLYTSPTCTSSHVPTARRVRRRRHSTWSLLHNQPFVSTYRTPTLSLPRRSMLAKSCLILFLEDHPKLTPLPCLIMFLQIKSNVSTKLFCTSGLQRLCLTFNHGRVPNFDTVLRPMTSPTSLPLTAPTQTENGDWLTTCVSNCFVDKPESTTVEVSYVKQVSW